jgi:hypothetical protein
MSESAAVAAIERDLAVAKERVRLLENLLADAEFAYAPMGDPSEAARSGRPKREPRQESDRPDWYSPTPFIPQPLTVHERRGEWPDDRG